MVQRNEHSADYLTYDSAYVARLICPAQGATQQQKSGLPKKRKNKDIVNSPPTDEQVGCVGVNVYPELAPSIMGDNTRHMAPTEHPSTEHFGP